MSRLRNLLLIGASTVAALVIIPVGMAITGGPRTVQITRTNTQPSIGTRVPIATHHAIARHHNNGRGSPSLVLPNPSYNALDGAIGETILGYAMPIPRTWIGTMSEAGDVQSFADMSMCTDVTADCPHVAFINLSYTDQSDLYGADPAVAWFNMAICPESTRRGAIREVDGTIDGQHVMYYQAPCGQPDPTSFNDNVVWYFPDRHVLVTGQEGRNGSLNPGTIEAVLKQAVWS